MLTICFGAGHPAAGKSLYWMVVFRWFCWCGCSCGCSFKCKTALEEALALRGNVFSSSETRLCRHYIYWCLQEIISCLTWPTAWSIYGCKLKQINLEELVGPFPHGHPGALGQHEFLNLSQLWEVAASNPPGAGWALRPKCLAAVQRFCLSSCSKTWKGHS